jgi:carbon monoxide dehydrogenase subunit G
MQLENSFEVAVPPDTAWEFLTDVPAVLPCMPGAELLEVVDTDHWKTRLQVRLGPISLQFLADVDRSSTDVAARRTVLDVEAREAKGRGTAKATITSAVEDASGGSRVSIVTDLALRGPLTQYGSIVVAPVAARLTEQFAACITKKLAPTPTPTEPAEDAAAREPAMSSDSAERDRTLRQLLVAVGRWLTQRRSS